MPEPRLRTKFVFLDTQTLRRFRCDFTGAKLAKLAEFAKKGQLRILVTEVTVREIKAQLDELLSEAQSALIKHAGILKPLGASFTVDPRVDGPAAKAALEATIEKFFKDVNSVNVPLISDLKGVLDDYFSSQPPFSAKKKSEFPDAIAIASIRAWCAQNRAAAYIVSEDSDLQSCCSESGPLYSAKSIEDIISQATVSQALHDALEKALRTSEYLSIELADKIMNLEVEVSRSYSHEVEIKHVSVENIHSITIIGLNVLDQDGQTFTCEPEVEVEIDVSVDVEFPSRWHEEYEPPRRHVLSKARTEYFYPEIVVRFDPDTGELEFESIYLSSRSLRIDLDDFR
jgi:hypothetical protein